jgi:hypothetical protein
MAGFLAEIAAPVKPKVVMNSFLVSNIVDFFLAPPIR